MTDITGIVNLVLLVGIIGVVISMLGKAERIATALEQLAADRIAARTDTEEKPLPSADDR